MEIASDRLRVHDSVGRFIDVAHGAMILQTAAADATFDRSFDRSLLTCRALYIT